MSNQFNPYGPYNSQYSTPNQPRGPQYEPIDNSAKLALGLGIGSLVLGCCPVIGAVMGIFAIMHGRHAMTLEAYNPSNKILGLIGFVCGVIGIAVSALMILLGVVANVLEPRGF